MAYKLKIISGGDIQQELMGILRTARVIKGSVAFWSWDDDFIDEYLGDRFTKALCHKESFYCVDFSHKSTNLDALAKLRENGANIYIFKYKWSAKINDMDLDYQLLHSKILYVKAYQKEYVIIGSHNNTKTAFLGRNIEHSILIEFDSKKTRNDQKFLDGIFSELNWIKEMSILLDSNEVENYRLLQSRDYPVYYNTVVFYSLNLSRTEIEQDQSLTLLSFPDPSNVNDPALNYKNNENIVFIIVCSDSVVVYRAKRDSFSHSEIGKYTLDTTESDMFAINLGYRARLSDFPYYIRMNIGNRIISGNDLRYNDTYISRYTLEEEIDINELVEFSQKNRIDSPWMKIEKELKHDAIMNEVLSHLNLDTKHLNKLEAIDRKKLSDEYRKMQEDSYPDSNVHLSPESFRKIVDCEKGKCIEAMSERIFDYILTPHDIVQDFKILDAAIDEYKISLGQIADSEAINKRNKLQFVKLVRIV